GVRVLCDEREALLIVDEVQTGLARTGRWFGYQHAAGLRPDIVTMAKALGNGVPIGACWARTEVAEAFKPGDHATTYGGQPLRSGVRVLCDEREALLIVDEVQTGLARTGRWFGYQHAAGLRPDIVTMAKALGNGVPIGACWARTEVAEAFKPGDHATTYGGQPL